MPTKLRRITLSLPPELDQALARFGSVTKGSQARFVVECLEGSIDVINGISDAVEAALSGDNERAGVLLTRQVKSLGDKLDDVGVDV